MIKLKSLLFEVEDDKVIGKNDRDEPVTYRQALDSSSDNPTMVKLKKKAQDLRDKEKGGEKEEPKAEPKQTSMSATGGFGGDDKDGGGKPKGERPPSIHLGNDINSGGWDELDDSLDSLKYSGHKDDHPSISYQIGDLVDLLNSGQATDEELEKAKEFEEKIDDLDSGMTREDDDHGMDELGRALGIAIEDADKKKSDTGGGDKPKGKVSEKPGGASHIELSLIQI